MKEESAHREIGTRAAGEDAVPGLARGERDDAHQRDDHAPAPCIRDSRSSRTIRASTTVTTG